jgi:hypothetical protein
MGLIRLGGPMRTPGRATLPANCRPPSLSNIKEQYILLLGYHITVWYARVILLKFRSSARGAALRNRLVNCGFEHLGVGIDEHPVFEASETPDECRCHVNEA